MADLDLHYVDELIEVRRKLHGGGVGAPPIVNGYHVGASLNRSCVVMLSALLQAYTEEVFKVAAGRRFPDLKANSANFKAYWKQIKSWGNPSDQNIKGLFLKIGVPDVFEGFSWKKRSTIEVRRRLDELNQIRNDIAHGTKRLSLNNKPYSLQLTNVEGFRNFAEQFGERFEAHVDKLIP